MENNKKGIYTIGIVYISFRESLCFVLEFLFNFKKDNLVILMIRSFFSLSRTSSSLSKIKVF